MNKPTKTAFQGDMLIQRIANRWQRPPLYNFISLISAGSGSVAARIQRTYSRAAVIQSRVEQLPVVRMEQYAVQHLQRFPDAISSSKQRTTKLSDQLSLPLVGAPIAKTPVATEPEKPQFRPASDPFAADLTESRDEEPEWLKRLPSFEEATSQLSFPDSINVKLPVREPKSTPTESLVSSSVAQQPPPIARKPKKDSHSRSGPKKMHVLTQVEEFSPGKRPPPVSLQDLRRVRVGKPQELAKPRPIISEESAKLPLEMEIQRKSTKKPDPHVAEEDAVEHTTPAVSNVEDGVPTTPAANSSSVAGEAPPAAPAQRKRRQAHCRGKVRCYQRTAGHSAQSVAFPGTQASGTSGCETCSPAPFPAWRTRSQLLRTRARDPLRLKRRLRSLPSVRRRRHHCRKSPLPWRTAGRSAQSAAFHGTQAS